MIQKNGELERGDMGEPQPCGTHSRAHLWLLQRMVEHSTNLADIEIEKTVRMAVSIRDDPDATRRDRMRAGELINALVAKGVDVAMYLHKNERLDDGHLTERVEHVSYAVAFDERAIA